MKELTQVEFDKQVERLLNGEITRKKLAKELDTDIRTLNGKITELSQTNLDLYQRYIQKFPYQPKTREDIDFEALVIKMMKQRMNLNMAAAEYDISRRTITRRIKDMEKTNTDLIEIYREYANCLRRGENLPSRVREQISQLELRPVVLSTITGKKEERLREEIEQFENLVSTGLSNAEAARRLGYDGYPTIWKKYKELERIEIEKNNHNKTEDSEEQTKEQIFRNSMKVTDIQVQPVINEKEEGTKTTELGNELEGK